MYKDHLCIFHWDEVEQSLTFVRQEFPPWDQLGLGERLEGARGVGPNLAAAAVGVGLGEENVAMRNC